MSNPRFVFVLMALLILFSLNGCQPQAEAPDPAATAGGVQTVKVSLPQMPAEGHFTPLSQAAEAIWQKHLNSLKGQPVQAACQPFRVAAQGKPRGSVLFFHGFTACPQQYWELSGKLAAAGFNVFVPLMPGHGRAFHQEKGKTLDDFSQLPADGDYVQYKRQAIEMNEMMRAEKGIKVVGGLSLGGVVAAAAVIAAPDLYDRALLMTPLFNVVEAKKPYLPPANAVVPTHLVEWGPDCELERQGGRGGICMFQIKHVRASQRLGEETLEGIGQVKTPIQIVGVEGDQAANNGALATAVHRLQKGQGCLYQHGVTHSMFSRYDSPDDKKFWLDSLQEQIVKFVSLGQFFERAKPSHELGLLRCYIP